MTSLLENKQKLTPLRKMRHTAITDLMSCLITRLTFSKINYRTLCPLLRAHHRGVWKVQQILLRFKERDFLSVTQLLPLMELECILASVLHFFSAYGRVKLFNETVNFLHWYRKFRDFPYHCMDKSHARQPVMSPWEC